MDKTIDSDIQCGKGEAVLSATVMKRMVKNNRRDTVFQRWLKSYSRQNRFTLSRGEKRV